MGRTVKSVEEKMLELDEKTLKEYDLIYRYKKSILLDSFIVILLIAPLMILYGVYFSNENYLLRMVFFAITLMFFGTYFLSDKIFKGASLGKRIYRIKVVSSSKNGFVSIHSIIYRRFLEVWINPSFTKMNFLQKSMYIDKMTNTKIKKLS